MYLHPYGDVAGKVFKNVEGCSQTKFPWDLPTPAPADGEGGSANTMDASVRTFNVRWGAKQEQIQADACQCLVQELDP